MHMHAMRDDKGDNTSRQSLDIRCPHPNAHIIHETTKDSVPFGLLKAGLPCPLANAIIVYLRLDHHGTTREQPCNGGVSEGRVGVGWGGGGGLYALSKTMSI